MIAPVVLLAGLAAMSTPGLGGADEPPRPEPPVTPPAIEIERATVDRWRPIFEATDSYRQARRRNLDLDDELLRFIARIERARERYGHLLDDDERGRITDAFFRDEIERTYNNSILLPQVSVSDAEVEQVYNNHRSTFQLPESAAVLEIFIWAPEGREPERSEARKMLSEAAGECRTADSFKALARERSDATSAYRGGNIGTVQKNVLSDPLRSVLFGSDALGLTDVLETEHGFYLFFVTRRTPAHTRTLEEKAPAIRRMLRRQRFEEIQKRDLAMLRQRHEVELLPLPPQPTPDTKVAEIDGDTLRFGELGIDPSTQTDRTADLVDAAIRRELYRRELDARRLGPSPSAHLRLEYRLYLETMERAARTDDARRIYTRILEQARSEIPEVEVERWTFDLLRISPVDSEGSYFAIFRLWSAAARQRADLADLARNIEQDLGLGCELRHFERINQHEVAELGPEIHTRLQRHLDLDELSTPIHLVDDESVAIVKLTDRTIDPVAGRDRHETKARRRALELLRVELEEDLNGGREISVREPSPLPGPAATETQ